MQPNLDQSLASQLDQIETIREKNGLVGLRILREEHQQTLDNGDVIGSVRNSVDKDD